MENYFDVLVIGGGHAGCEAAHAAAQMGFKTLMLTMSLETIGQMSCNPAIGGVGKGHLVKEIDALGGIMGKMADETGIQFRRLNTKKGSAVQATRCQSDMIRYKNHIRKFLEAVPNLSIKQREVTGLLWGKDEVKGVKTSLEEEIFSKTLVITTGTFLNGLIHIGKQKFSAGRAWEFAATQLSDDLQDQGLLMGRLKTGTTPRLSRHTIDFSKLEEQKGDLPLPKFSFFDTAAPLPQVPCYITYTNSTTHSVIEQNLHLSAIYGGAIQSTGPRYCPSIEDKVVKFREKERHQIFLEPVSLDSIEIYPNGISTSLPLEVQEKFLRTIVGLEQVEVMRPGYAIEYDFLYPHQLKLSLESKAYKNLFFAGQINGTTGYEEAAAQGILAGINAALAVADKEPLELLRNQSYIGVLVDDLVVNGTNEPYRMFTSRAEYRLILREDNADERLCEIGYKLGLLEETKYHKFLAKQEKIGQLKSYIQEQRAIKAPALDVSSSLQKILPMKPSFYQLLKQPEVNFELLTNLASSEQLEVLEDFSQEEKFRVENDCKYEGYVKRQEAQIRQYLKFGKTKIPLQCPFHLIPGLSLEVREKLAKNRPQTLEQAKKISGVTPAALTILYVYLQKNSTERKAS